MLIKYLSGPKSGQMEHVQNSVGNFAISSGMAEAVLPQQGATRTLEAIAASNPGAALHAPLPPPEPLWRVVTIKGAGSRVTLAIEMSIDSAVYHYVGKPEKANAKRTWDGGFNYLNGFGREVPASIVDEYARAYKANPDQRFLGPYAPSGGPSNSSQAADLKSYGGAFVPLRPEH